MTPVLAMIKENLMSEELNPAFSSLEGKGLSKLQYYDT